MLVQLIYNGFHVAIIVEIVFIVNYDIIIF